MLPVSGAEQLNDFRREAHAAHHFGQRRIFEIGEARAVLAVRQEHVPQALRLRDFLQLFDDRHDDPAIALLASPLPSARYSFLPPDRRGAP